MRSLLASLVFCSLFPSLSVTNAQNANVVFRNDSLGVNPPCYLALNLPALGTTFQATVDITGDPNNFVAWIVGYQAPLNGLPTNLGILLIDPTTVLAVLEIRGGFNQVHTFDFAIPNDTALAGTTVFTQGVIQNLQTGFTLCNANDVTLGFDLEFPKGTGGPGGFVLADGQGPLELWYRADVDVDHIVTGGVDQVTAWLDQSGGDEDATPSASNPIFDPIGGINGQPVLRFKTEALEANRPVEDDFTLFVIASTNDNTTIDISSGTAWETSPALIGAAVVGSGDDFHLGVNGGQVVFVVDGDVQTSAGTVNDGAPHTLECVRDSGGLAQIYIDGIQDLFVIAGGVSTLDGPEKIQIGASTSTQGFFEGEIYEVIILSSLITFNERLILSNYAASKYGIPAIIDYYSLDATHGNDVVGFGRFNFLDFRTEAEGPGIVKISNPSAQSAGDYLFWGTDMPRVFTLSTQVPGGLTHRWLRTWGLEETEGGSGNGIGTVDIRFRTKGLALPTVAGNYALLTDTDLDFSDATIFTGGASFDAVEETITFAGFDPTGVNYFTLGFTLP